MSRVEVGEAIDKLKRNKVAGLNELEKECFKFGGEVVGE